MGRRKKSEMEFKPTYTKSVPEMSKYDFTPLLKYLKREEWLELNINEIRQLTGASSYCQNPTSVAATINKYVETGKIKQSITAVTRRVNGEKKLFVRLT